MAKVTGLNQSPRAPAMRRAVYFRPGPSGQVAAVWPQRSKASLSPKQKEAIAAFKEAAIIAKYAPAKDQMRSRELAKGSQFLPRDLQYMAIFGRLCSLFFTNGERRYQLASRYDLTELLDILGFAPGSILFRGPEFWEALPPGNAGEVLTTSGALLPPVWAPAAGGAGGGFSGFSGSAGSGVSSLGGATAGNYMVPAKSVDISAAGFISTSTAGNRDYTAYLARIGPAVDGYPILDLVQLGPASASESGPYRVVRLYLDEPVTMIGGQAYSLLWAMQYGNGTNYAHQIANTANNGGMFMSNGPIRSWAFYMAWNTLTPAVSMTPDYTTGRWLNSWVEGALSPED